MTNILRKSLKNISGTDLSKSPADQIIKTEICIEKPHRNRKRRQNYHHSIGQDEARLQKPGFASLSVCSSEQTDHYGLPDPLIFVAGPEAKPADSVLILSKW